MILKPYEIQQHQKNMCRILLQSETDQLMKEIQQKNLKIDELVQKIEHLSQEIPRQQKQMNLNSNLLNSDEFLMWL